MISIPKGAVARLNRAVRMNMTAIIAAAAKPTAAERSQRKPLPAGEGPTMSRNSGARTKTR